MTQEDAPMFIAKLVACAEVYNRELSAPAQAMYFDALSDFDLTAVLLALDQAVSGRIQFPVPAVIREILEGSQSDRTELAWIAWKEAAHRHGSYTSLVLDDAALAETILTVFGSWPAACSLELSEEMWSSKRKEFERVYRVQLRRSLKGPRRLAGLTETQNTNKEWERFTPVAHIGLSADQKLLN